MTSKYKVGDEVRNVNNLNEKGVIIDVLPLRRGLQTYRVKYPTSTETELEQNLQIILDINDPFELIKKSVSSHLDFQQKNTSVKIRNTCNNTISTLKASKTIFQPYQYKPLLKFLNSDKRRIIIGDEVGVGKTIEAGHIMLELIGRQEMKSGLIICPKSLIEKWRDELLNKFNLNFKIYENKEDVISDLNYRPSQFKGIINYEKLRESKQTKKTENDSNPKKDLIRYIEENNIRFDFVVCDESHKLRNRTKTYIGVKKITKFADGVVFLTATPIMTEKRNLFNQLALLDSESYFDNVVFENQDSINRPIIKALNHLNNNDSFENILKILENEVVILKYMSDEADLETNSASTENRLIADLFKDDNLYHKVIESLKKLPDTPENRVNIQHDLSSLNTLNSIFTRTRKKDVTTDWSNAIRKTDLLIANLSSEELEIYNDEIEKYEYEKGEDNILGMIQIKRQLSSSLYGYLAKDNSRYDLYIKEHDTKYLDLQKIIKEVAVNNKKKIIVFATFKATLKYLQIRLRKDTITSEIISGDLDVTERNTAISNFKKNKDVCVLLSSEVGSEGIDMQFCDTIVNYDLPWNPMVVEQRIGRIHRFGQQSPIIHIYTIVTEGSIEKDIYERLLDRIGIFRTSIGELEPILVDINGKDLLKDFEKTLYSKSLTEEQKKSKMDDIVRAIEQTKIDLESIKAGLEDAITSDIYFDNEIRRINENFKYVAENELKNFVYSIIDKELSTLNLKKLSDTLYKLVIPKNDKSTFIRFLEDNSPPVEDFDNYSLSRYFINEIRYSNELIVTFNQETAFEDKNILFLNAYHPFILAIKKYFESSSEQSFTFKFSLSSNIGLKRGKYMLGVYNLFVIKESNKDKKVKELLVPIVYDINKSKIIDEEEFGEKLLGYSQQYAMASNEEYSIPESCVDEIQIEMPLKINEVQNRIKENENLQMISHLQRRKKQEKLYYEFRIKQIQSTINDLLQNNYDDSTEAKKRRSIIPALEKNIENYQQEMESKARYYDSYQLSTKAELLSLSLINI